LLRKESFVLQGTIIFGLFYKKDKESDLIIFTDSDYVGDLDGEGGLRAMFLCLGQGLFHGLLKNNPLSLCQAKKLKSL